MNANDCTSLYRFYDEYETLLYVGITSRGYSRFDEHSGDKVWWKLTASSKIEHFKTRPEAQVAERVAIQKEKPAFNEKMAGDWKRNIDAYYGAREDRLRRELSASPAVSAPESWAPPAEPEDYGYSKYRLGYTEPPLVQLPPQRMTLEEFAGLAPAWPKDVSGLGDELDDGSRGVMVARVHDRHKRAVGDEDVVVRVLIRYPGEGLQRLTVRSCFLSGPRARSVVGNWYLPLYREIIEQAKRLPVIEFPSEVPA